MEKWTRNYILTVQTDEKAADYIDVTFPLTIEFRIVRNINADANSATFTIYNLSEDSRRKIFLDRYKTMYYKGIEFRAGYGDRKETLPLIFKGNIQQAFSRRNGVDYLTEIDAFDGGFAFVNGNTNRSFTEGTPDKQIIETLIKDLPGVSKGAIGNFGVKLLKGNAFNGSTADLINEITEQHFFIDLEKAYCLRDNEVIEGNLQVINSATGLLGSPLREEAFLTFDMIFEPRINIGQYIKLESQTERFFNGTYKVLGVEHTGTISGATSGECKTKVSLWYCDKPPKVIG